MPAKAAGDQPAFNVTETRHAGKGQILENRWAEMDMDEWGKDPAVQAMRRVFKGMETSLGEVLEQLAISPNDHRIRSWLEKALAKFEQSWGVAHQMGIRCSWRRSKKGMVDKLNS